MPLLTAGYTCHPCISKAMLASAAAMFASWMPFVGAANAAASSTAEEGLQPGTIILFAVGTVIAVVAAAPKSDTKTTAAPAKKAAAPAKSVQAKSAPAAAKKAPEPAKKAPEPAKVMLYNVSAAAALTFCRH